MRPELALELKQAGYPQHEGHDYYDHRCDAGIMVNACIPTLSELIGACGKDFNYLSLVDNDWLAMRVIHGNNHHMIEPEYGRTPEEAVAKLWLVLNKK